MKNRHNCTDASKFWICLIVWRREVMETVLLCLHLLFFNWLIDKIRIRFFTNAFQLAGKISSRKLRFLRSIRAQFIQDASAVCTAVRNKGVFQTSIQLRIDLSCLIPLVIATSQIQIQLIQQNIKSCFPASFSHTEWGSIQLV